MPFNLFIPNFKFHLKATIPCQLISILDPRCFSGGAVSHSFQTLSTFSGFQKHDGLAYPGWLCSYPSRAFPECRPYQIPNSANAVYLQSTLYIICLPMNFPPTPNLASVCFAAVHCPDTGKDHPAPRVYRGVPGLPDLHLWHLRLPWRILRPVRHRQSTVTILAGGGLVDSLNLFYSVIFQF